MPIKIQPRNIRDCKKAVLIEKLINYQLEQESEKSRLLKEIIFGTKHEFL